MNHVLNAGPRRFLRVAIASAVVGGAAASGNAQPAAEPDPLLARTLQVEGLPAGPESIDRLLSSDQPHLQGAGLRLARILGDRSRQDAAESMVAGPSALAKLHGATYLTWLGQTEYRTLLEQEVDRSFTSLARVRAPDQSQTYTIEAARLLAELGDDGYVYQSHFLLNRGFFDARLRAAESLWAYNDLTDRTTQFVWATAIGVYNSAASDQDPRVREWSIAYAVPLLEALATLEFTTPSITALVRNASQIRSEESGAALAQAFAAQADRLSQLPVLTETGSIPGFDPDPVEQSRASMLNAMKAIDAGTFDDVLSAADMQEGLFDGLDPTEWVAHQEQTYIPIPPGDEEGYTNEMVVSLRRPDPERIEAVLEADMLNRATGVWEAIRFTGSFEWFGLGWHLHRFDREVLYEIVEVGGIFDVPLEVTPQRFAGIEGPIVQFFEGLTFQDWRTIEPILFEHGRFQGDMTKEQFVAQLRQRFANQAGELGGVAPVRISVAAASPSFGADGSTASGYIDAIGKNMRVQSPIRNAFRFQVVRQDGEWYLSRLLAGAQDPEDETSLGR